MPSKDRTESKAGSPRNARIAVACIETNPMIRPISPMLAALLCGGCSFAPNVPLFGAFFPAWMLCALIGIGLALVVRTLSVVTGLARRVAIPPVTYVLLAVLFGAAGWIFFFRG
jgi:hypothetical protein